MGYRPCGVYHQYYRQDHAWWQTRFVWGKMILLLITVFYLIPNFLNLYLVSVANVIGYTILSAMGVQLLIGYCGQVTLGHSAFIAVGAYTSTLLMLQLHLPYPITLILGGIMGGLWCVLFGLPSARVKGFYLIMTTMAAQFITVEFFITQYVSQIGGRGVAFAIPPGTVKIGPWTIQSDLEVYYLMATLVVLCTLVMANLLRSKIGRAWIAIRDNDIAAEALGVNTSTTSFWPSLWQVFSEGLQEPSGSPPFRPSVPNIFSSAGLSGWSGSFSSGGLEASMERSSAPCS